jgi:hypothetical protein
MNHCDPSLDEQVKKAVHYLAFYAARATAGVFYVCRVTFEFTHEKSTQLSKFLDPRGKYSGKSDVQEKDVPDVDENDSGDEVSQPGGA